MVDCMAESKAAKKNKKRKAGKKASTQLGSTPFEIEEDVSVPVAAPASDKLPSSQPAPIDPIAKLRKQIEEAKAAKDHVRAQELRQKMWVLQDTLVLGKAGPNAPEVDLQEFLPAMKQSTNQDSDAGAPPPSSTDADPTEKKLNRLHKKLKKIEALKERHEKGEELEANQIDKIKTIPELQEEISILEHLLSGK